MCIHLLGLLADGHIANVAHCLEMAIELGFFLLKLLIRTWLIGGIGLDPCKYSCSVSKFGP